MDEHTTTPRRRTARTAITAGAVALALVASGSLVSSAAFAVTYPTAPVVTGSGLHPVGAEFLSNSKAFIVDQNAFVNFVNATTDTETSQTFLSGQDGCFMSGAALQGSSLYAPGYNCFGSRLMKFSTTANTYSYTALNGVGTTGAIEITPDGSTALIVGNTSLTNEAAVFKVSLPSGAVTPIVIGASTGGQHPTAVVITDDGSTAYATTPGATLAKIDVAAATSTNVTIPSQAQGLALSADGSTLYVASINGAVSTIATATGAVSPLVTLPGAALSSLAVTPDGTKLVVTGNISGGADYAWVLAEADGSEVSRFYVSSGSWDVAIAPDGSKAYVVGQSNGKTSVVPLTNIKPTLTKSTAPSSATVGVAYTAQFAAVGYPKPTFTHTGTLPPGLTLYSSGRLSGKPTAGGKFSFAVVATNGVSPDATGATQTVTVLKVFTKMNTPSVSGTKKVGKTLTAKTTAWSPSGVTLKYQWYRYDKGAWKKISGATKTTYKLTSSDKGKSVRVTVTGTKTGYAPASKNSTSYKIG